MFKKKPAAKLCLGVDVKRCSECPRNERRCLVDDKPAVFLRWVEEVKALLRVNYFVLPEEADILRRRFDDTKIVPHGCSTETIRELLALVEYPDGSVGKVKPELITFLED